MKITLEAREVNMKVYFISSKYDGCYYVRCLLPLFHNAWDGAKRFLTQPKASSEEMFKGAMNADIIVFQRPDTPDKTKAIELLKRAGKKIVFDNDDTYRPDSGFPKLEMLGNKTMVEEINEELYKNVKQADLVTTTTDFLAQEYKPLNKNVVVLPNCIDPFDWSEPKRNKGDRVRIGLVGSVGYDDYKTIEGYLNELGERDDVQLVMFSLSKPEYVNDRVKELYKDSYEFVEKLNIEWHSHVSMENYPDKLNSLELDIMLIPRRETYFNKCKSNVKYLEAGMLEIPVVAQSFSDGNSPYDKDLNGKNGILCSTEADWKREVDNLIADKKLRRAIGKAAKKYVLKNYNIENKAKLWKEAYKTI